MGSLLLFLILRRSELLSEILNVTCGWRAFLVVLCTTLMMFQVNVFHLPTSPLVSFIKQFLLPAPEHQEMNGQVEVTWRTLRTFTHSLMVHARVLEAYIRFALIYTTDHIFLVLPIKDLIKRVVL